MKMRGLTLKATVNSLGRQNLLWVIIYNLRVNLRIWGVQWRSCYIQLKYEAIIFVQSVARFHVLWFRFETQRLKKFWSDTLNLFLMFQIMESLFRRDWEELQQIPISWSTRWSEPNLPEVEMIEFPKLISRMLNQKGVIIHSFLTQTQSEPRFC